MVRKLGLLSLIARSGRTGVSILALRIFLLVFICQTIAGTVGAYDLNILAATDRPGGIHFSWTTCNGTKSLNLTGHHFPDNYYKLLNILLIEVASDQLFTFLSVEDGILSINFDLSDGNIASFNVSSWPEMYCQPTTLFYVKYTPFTPCLNRTDNTLRFVPLQVDTSSLAVSVLGTYSGGPVPYLEPLSKFVRTDTGCPGITNQKNNILFTFNDTVCAYDSDGESLEPTCAKILSENCSYVLDLKQTTGETVNVYCMGNIVEAVDVCDFKPVATYSLSSTGIPIPCSQDLTVYINESGVYVPAGATGDRPTSGLWKDGDYGTFENGNCVKTESGTFLILVFENSTVIVMDIFKRSVYTLTNTSCTIDGRCLYPQVWEERFISYTNGTHSLVKDLSCLSNPILLAVDTVADVILVFTGPTPPPPPYNNCEEILPTSILVTATTNRPLPTQTYSSMLLMPTESNKPPIIIPPSDKQSSLETNLSIGIASILFFIAIVLAVVLLISYTVFYLHKKYGKLRGRRTSSRTPLVQGANQLHVPLEPLSPEPRLSIEEERPPESARDMLVGTSQPPVATNPPSIPATDSTVSERDPEIESILSTTRSEYEVDGCSLPDDDTTCTCIPTECDNDNANSEQVAP